MFSRLRRARRRAQLRPVCQLVACVEVLEQRTLLCFDVLHAGTDLLGREEQSGHDAGEHGHDSHGDPLPNIGTFGAIEESAEAGDPTGGGSGGAAVGSNPLTSIPALNSLSGAAASLYLDFDGHFDAVWGSYSNVTTPVFDQDGDLTTFSDGELATIQSIWSRVAEDFIPFKMNVTTVEPPSFANGAALRVAIGGDGLWSGGTYGGVAYVNAFTNSIANTVYVFPKNLSNGNAKYTAEASSHESGHGFGLQHQSLYDANGTKTNEYYSGPGDGRAPIMGNSYSATRGLWWYGTSATSSTTYQDDLLVISRSTNGFGYRTDDHGDTVAAATPLNVSGSQVSGSGILTSTADRDFFSFSTEAGQISLTVSVPANINNLDSSLELRDSGGTLLASAAPTTSFGATITQTVVAGSYRLVVASNGSYGDVGQYTVSGTIIANVNGVNAPTNLTATAVSTSQINLAWTDNATNETGYTVERSSDGATWSSLATLAAGSISYADGSLVAGTSYFYRVRAFNASANSDYSNVASTTTVPTAPSGLTATAISSSRIDLSWSNVSGETGYEIDRSPDGATWTQIATTGANVATFSNTGLNANTTYSYRVRATNGSGDSASSNTASATTPATPSIPAAPSNLSAVAISAKRVDLSWTDNSSNETSFKVERSSNGGRAWTQIAQVGAGVTSYSDTTTAKNKTYSYRVRSSNEVGNSAYSNVVKVTTPSAAAGFVPGAVAEFDESPNELSLPTEARVSESLSRANPPALPLDGSVTAGLLSNRVSGTGSLRHAQLSGNQFRLGEASAAETNLNSAALRGRVDSHRDSGHSDIAWHRAVDSYFANDRGLADELLSSGF